MLTKTIGQLSAATSITEDDYLEIEQSGASLRATLQQLACFAIPCGTLIDVAYEKPVSSTFPAVALWDADHDISEANYPILVPELRDAIASVTLTAGTVVTSINVNATSGSVLSSVDSAFTIICNAIVEEYAVQGAYDIAVTIGGTEYEITSASSTLTISGTIATGATTMSVYPHRIVGSTTTARVFKDSGRATLSHNGNAYIAGFRRRDRLQGHYHSAMSAAGGGTSAAGIPGLGNSSGTPATDADVAKFEVRAPKSDGSNGTPRIGSTTDPNSTIVYRYLWAQEYTA